MTLNSTMKRILVIPLWLAIWIIIATILFGIVGNFLKEDQSWQNVSPLGPIREIFINE